MTQLASRCNAPTIHPPAAPVRRFLGWRSPSLISSKKIAARAIQQPISDIKRSEIRQQHARPALFQGAHPAPIISSMRRSLLALISLCLLAVSGLPAAAATRPAFGDDPADSSKNPAASAPSVKTENGTPEREPPASNNGSHRTGRGYAGFRRLNPAYGPSTRIPLKRRF